jgi:uncharacterized protein YgbK (DUF1537 family)
MISSGVRHLTFDASNEGHLNRIAALAVRKNGLLVGSAGLAEAVARTWFGNTLRLRQGERDRPRKGGHLLVCGSSSERAASQVRALLKARPFRWIQVPAPVLADPASGGRLGEWTRTVVEEMGLGDLVVTVEPIPGDPGAGKFDPRRAPIVASRLGELVAEAVRARRPSTLFLTGGDTAEAVLQALGVRSVRLQGEILKGMPHGVVHSRSLSGLPVATKAGSFGPEDALVRWHAFWSPSV